MFISAMAVAGLAATLLAAPATVPSTSGSPPSGRITVDVETVNGSGCPQGTATATVSPDNTAFTVSFDNYVAAVGPSIPPIEFRKNCQLVLRVHVPQGFTYAIARSSYLGYAHLEDGASALQRASYYIQGTSPTRRISHSLSGPMDDYWHNTDTVDVAALVYAACGESTIFNVNTELRVYKGSSNPNKTSFITMSSTQGRVNTIFHFAWKTCSAT